MPINKSHLFQIKITLKGSQPAVWRRIRLGSETTLAQLHTIIQISMGWGNQHMHLFQTDKDTLYGPPEENDGSLPMKDEGLATLGKLLRKPGKRLHYEYDFGDGWEHDILLEKQLPQIGEPPIPHCIQASGACPPEDVGGIPGYRHFLEAIGNPNHPDHVNMANWLGADGFDPTGVDVDDINKDLETLWNRPNPTETAPGRNPSENVMGELKRRIAEQGVESEEELQQLLNTIMTERNQQVVDDFQGLNPKQMHALLNHPFDSPELLTWSDNPPEVKHTPILRMANVLLEELDTQSIKLTPKGNLPLATVRAMAQELNADLLALEWETKDTLNRIRSEDNIKPVQVARILVELSGTIKKQNNRLSLTKAGKREQREQNPGQLYLALLQTMMRKLNWAFVAGIDELPSIQNTAAFNFWLLHRHGEHWQTTDFYADLFLKAFPMVIDEVTERPRLDTRSVAMACYRARVEALFSWFGLIEMRPAHRDSVTGIETHEIRASKLFSNLIDWQEAR